MGAKKINCTCTGFRRQSQSWNEKEDMSATKMVVQDADWGAGR